MPLKKTKIFFVFSLAIISFIFTHINKSHAAQYTYIWNTASSTYDNFSNPASSSQTYYFYSTTNLTNAIWGYHNGGQSWNQGQTITSNGNNIWSFLHSPASNMTNSQLTAGCGFQCYTAFNNFNGNSLILYDTQSEAQQDKNGSINITFDFPVSTSTPINDFSNFIVTGHNLTNGAIPFQYGASVLFNTTSSYFDSDVANGKLTNGDIQSTIYENNINLSTSTIAFYPQKPTPLLPGTTYYAKAYLGVHGTQLSQALATTTVVSFTINTSGVIDFNTEYATSSPPGFTYDYNATSTQQFISTWACPVNLFGFSTLDLCSTAQQVIYNLFSINSPYLQAEFTTLINEMKNAFPISWIVHLYSDMNLTDPYTSQNRPDFTVNFTIPGTSSTLVSFSLASTTQEFNSKQSSITVSDIRQFFVFFLWFDFIFYVVWRFRIKFNVNS